jgi:DNA-binding NtrC family response regulator
MFKKKTKNIFIVGDNEIYSMMLGYILSQESIYEFVSFKSGEECVKNLHQNPNIVVLDYDLKGTKNSYETLLEIKKMKPFTYLLLIIEPSDLDSIQQLLKAGVNDFVVKKENLEKRIIEKIEKIHAKYNFAVSSADQRLIIPSPTEFFYFLIIVLLLAFGVYLLQ